MMLASTLTGVKFPLLCSQSSCLVAEAITLLYQIILTLVKPILKVFSNRTDGEI